ncbi:MAG: pyridoxal-5-phosphate-dependent protein subunit beta, partial [Candidatus Eisenbacteria bacterium]
CNLVAGIKAAKYYEMDSRDILFTPLTDSMELYGSRVQELREAQGPYTVEQAGRHYARYMEGIGIDYLHELDHYDRKRLHNFKYFTWVEQQGRTVEELRELWEPDFWEETFDQVDEWDRLIRQFNERTGLLKA